MSRRSLRLHTPGCRYGDDSLLDSSPNHSAAHSVTYTAGSANRRESRTLKSRRQHQALSGSQSLLLTPRRSESAALLGHTSLHSCAASDSSLLSTLLDESCIQERTLVDSFWGLDEETDVREHSFRAGRSVSVLNGGDMNTAQTQTSVINGYSCGDCSLHSERREALTAYSSSQKPSSSSSSSSAVGAVSASASRSASADSVSMATAAGSTVYSRDKTRRHTGKAAAGAFWWLGTGWYQLVTLVSMLNVFILTRVLPKLYKLMLFLLPFLLLLGLWFWWPAALLSYLPSVNLTDWSSAALLPWAGTPASPTPLEKMIPPTTALPQAASHPTGALPPALSQQEDHVAAVSAATVSAAAVSVATVGADAERLSRLEQSLSRLWEGVQGGARLQERQHGEVLGLHASLQEQLDRRTDRDGLALWLSGLLDQRLALLRGEMEQGAERGGQVQQQYVQQQQGHESRLAEMETLLQALAAKTEELQQRGETDTAVPVSVGVDHESHNALLSQVQKLEAELGRIRQELQGVIGCQGRCEQLDGLQDTVSAQIKQELRTLFYGSAQTQMQTEEEEEERKLPEPLLPWLSAQFARGADLRSTLASLERSILGNLSLQLEQSAQPACAASIAHTVASTAGAAGMSEEHVQLIVKNALTLYSQDRTGLVDYALESGGGSVLSTRCSETYETKTALMSLFGLPLWYFSQSPRVVIQPDVYPGNCWAFKGSQGYLVIRLSLRVRPTAFSLEHIPKSLSPTGNISSAPRQFTVYGLDDESQEEGTVLGHYTYQEDGDALQTFPTTVQNERSYQIIEVRVRSNWGHPEYTCLYRFRVHGDPQRT